MNRVLIFIAGLVLAANSGADCYAGSDFVVNVGTTEIYVYANSVFIAPIEPGEILSFAGYPSLDGSDASGNSICTNTRRVE